MSCKWLPCGVSSGQVGVAVGYDVSERCCTRVVLQSRRCGRVWSSQQPERVAATNGGSTGMAPCLTAMQSAMSGVVYLRPGTRLGLTLAHNNLEASVPPVNFFSALQPPSRLANHTTRSLLKSRKEHPKQWRQTRSSRKSLPVTRNRRSRPKPRPAMRHRLRMLRFPSTLFKPSSSSRASKMLQPN